MFTISKLMLPHQLFQPTPKLDLLAFSNSSDFTTPAPELPVLSAPTFPTPTPELPDTPQPLPIQTKLKNEPLGNWNAPEKNIQEVMAECMPTLYQDGTAGHCGTNACQASHIWRGSHEEVYPLPPPGCRELVLPQSVRGLWAIKCTIFKLYPECWSKVLSLHGWSSFEPARKKA